MHSESELQQPPHSLPYSGPDQSETWKNPGPGGTGAVDRDQSSSANRRNGELESEESFPEAKIFDLSFSQKVAVSSGHILNDICASMWFSYFLMYAQKIVGFSSNIAASLLFLGQMTDSFATPLVGYEADQGFGQRDYWLCRSKFGRYKSWHLLGVLLTVVTFPFIFSPVIGATEETSEWAKIIYYAPFIVVYETSWACTQISHLALIPKTNPDVLTRTEILAMRFVLTVVANVVLFLMITFVLGFGEKCVVDESESGAFMTIALIVAGGGGLCALVFYALVKEYPDERVKVAVHQWTRREDWRNEQKQKGENIEVEPTQNLDSSEQERRPLLPSTGRKSEQRVSLVEKYSTKRLNPGMEVMRAQDWIRFAQFYFVAVVYVSSRLVINVPQAYMPLYLQESLHLPCSAIATLPMAYWIAGFFVATCIKPVNRWTGRQVSFVIGTIFNIVGSAVIVYGDWSPTGFLHSKGIYIVFALLGAGASTGQITSLSITADMIGNNVESGAFVYGVMSFGEKMSCGLIVLLINSLSPTQRLAVDSNRETEEFYRNVMGYSNIACSIFGIVGVLVLTAIIRKMNGNGSRNF